MILNQLLRVFTAPIELEIQPKKLKLSRKKSKDEPPISLEGEEWRDIKNNARYQISSFGRARRKPHQITRTDGKVQTYGWKILKPQWHPGGVNPHYKMISEELSKQVSLQVTRLMADAFNIEYTETECFSRINPFVLPTISDLIPIERSDLLKGTPKSHRPDLQPSEKKVILMLRKEGMSRQKVAEMFNLTPEYVSSITGNIRSLHDSK